MEQQVFSYTRFSTTTQKAGNSDSRQLSAAKNWCDRHGKVLSADTYRDAGVPAFKGVHRERGALGVMLKAIEVGTIRRGSILLIEAFDRLSREPLTVAQSVALSIVNNGVTIITLEDEVVYSYETLNNNDALAHMLTGKIQAAHTFSKRLSNAGGTGKSSLTGKRTHQQNSPDQTLSGLVEVIR